MSEIVPRPVDPTVSVTALPIDWIMKMLAGVGWKTILKVAIRFLLDNNHATLQSLANQAAPIVADAFTADERSFLHDLAHTVLRDDPSPKAPV